GPVLSESSEHGSVCVCVCVCVCVVSQGSVVGNINTGGRMLSGHRALHLHCGATLLTRGILHTICPGCLQLGGGACSNIFDVMTPSADPVTSFCQEFPCIGRQPSALSLFHP
ncbi:mCG145230, partial [Mus musculus]